MGLLQLKRLCFGLILLAFLFPPCVKAEPVSKWPVEPILDHAWRKDEYPQGFFAAQANGNPRIYQEVDILHYTIDVEFFLGGSYPDSGYLEAVTTIDGQAKAENPCPIS